MHREYGPVVQLAPREISFCHPDALRLIYAGSRTGLDTPKDSIFLRQYGSDNLVSTVNPELHRARKKTIMALYTPMAISCPSKMTVFYTLIDKFLAVLESEARESSSRTVDVFPLFRALAADIVFRLVYGSKKPLNLLTGTDPDKQEPILEELLDPVSQENSGIGVALAKVIPCM